MGRPVGAPECDRVTDLQQQIPDPVQISDRMRPSPRGPVFAGRGSRNTYIPAATAPESVSGLSPTMRVRSGSTCNWSHAVRNTVAAGLQTPYSNDITTVFRNGDSPSRSIAGRRSKPVSLTIPTRRPRSRRAFRVGRVSGNASHDSALTV